MRTTPVVALKSKYASTCRLSPKPFTTTLPVEGNVKHSPRVTGAR
jgi:hypothetical protein